MERAIGALLAYVVYVYVRMHIVAAVVKKNRGRGFRRNALDRNA